jgi:hypothetical protein
MGETLFEPDRYDRVVARLHESRFWTDRDPVKDRQLVAELAAAYPQLDLAEQVVLWDAWMADHQSKKKVRVRARFAQWVVNAARFASERRGSPRTRRPAGGGPRAGGAPSASGSWSGGSGYREF